MLVPSEWRPGGLASILQCSGEVIIRKNDAVRNGNEKPRAMVSCLHEIMLVRSRAHSYQWHSFLHSQASTQRRKKDPGSSFLQQLEF